MNANEHSKASSELHAIYLMEPYVSISQLVMCSNLQHIVLTLLQTNIIVNNFCNLNIEGRIINFEDSF